MPFPSFSRNFQFHRRDSNFLRNVSAAKGPFTLNQGWLVIFVSRGYTSHSTLERKINRLQQERKILTDALKEWYDEVGQHKLLSMSMIYDQAKLLSEKMGLATIDKPRAFVDGFMRHGNIRISDTPYAKARFHIHLS